jgi:hypothetical protein
MTSGFHSETFQKILDVWTSLDDAVGVENFIDKFVEELKNENN